MTMINLKDTTSLSTHRILNAQAAAAAKPKYTGPAEPVDWDPNYNKFTNLTKDQIATFDGMPQALLFYAHHQAWCSLEANKVAKMAAGQTDIEGAHLAYMEKIATAQVALGTIVAGITASPPSVTKREHVDAAFKSK